MQDSSLPPIVKSHRGRYLVLFLLLVGGLLVWWFWCSGSDATETDAKERAAASTPTVQREQFQADLEIPEDVFDGGQAEPSEKKRRGVQPRCSGTLDASAIRQAIDGVPRRQVQTCYERGLKQNNELQGSVNLLLTIGTDGQVANVVTRGTLSDRLTLSCMRNVARTWKFPTPEGGCVQTSVPFTLTPKR